MNTYDQWLEQPNEDAEKMSNEIEHKIQKRYTELQSDPVDLIEQFIDNAHKFTKDDLKLIGEILQREIESERIGIASFIYKLAEFDAA